MENQKQERKIVFNFVARDVEGMNCHQKCLLMHLAAYANAKGECWPSIETLVRKTGISRSGVIRSIAGLKNLGMIHYERGGSLKGKSNKYQLQLRAMQALVPVSQRHPAATDQCQGDTQFFEASVMVTPDGCPSDTFTSVTLKPQVCSEVCNEVSTKVKDEVCNKIKNEAASPAGKSVSGLSDDPTPSTHTPANSASTSVARPSVAHLAPIATRPDGILTGVIDDAPRKIKLTGIAPDRGPWEGYPERLAALLAATDRKLDSDIERDMQA